MDGSKILSMVVKNLHFLDSLNYLPVIIKSMPESFDLLCKKGYYPISLTLPTIWIMWALILNPNNMGRTLCLVMNELNFQSGMRG